MANAKTDNNNVKTLMGVLNTDGATPTLVEASPTTHAVIVGDNGSGSDNGDDDASHDDNRVTTMVAVSSSDGSSPVPLYVDANGLLLVKSS